MLDARGVLDMQDVVNGTWGYGIKGLFVLYIHNIKEYQLFLTRIGVI